MAVCCRVGAAQHIRSIDRWTLRFHENDKGPKSNIRLSERTGDLSTLHAPRVYV